MENRKIAVSTSQNLKELLDTGRTAIEERFRSSGDGIRASIEQTALMDRVLSLAFEECAGEAGQEIAVLALGGYGRGELFPHSDVDVMILSGTGQQQVPAGVTARAFLHVLWDVGLNVGHSVRTIAEALAQHGAAIDAWIAMLESRCLCGNHALAGTLYASMREKWIRTADSWLTGMVLEESAARQARFGSSVKLLEPNVKKSAGGLRDLQTVYWLHRGTDPSGFIPIDPATPATLTFLNRLRKDGVLEEDVHAATVEALRFLFRVRTAMHLASKGQHDTLEYALQETVAEMLGYRRVTEMRPVEVFMRDYYLHARTVHTVYQSLGQHFRESLEESPRFWNRGRRVGTIFRLRDGILTLDEPQGRLPSAAGIFETFSLAADLGAELGVSLRTAIGRSADMVTPEVAASPSCMAMLRQVFTSGRVSATLRDMNELNILGRVIPEFGELIAFFQHNVYHYYSADEHTLIALARVEGLAEGEGLLHDVYRALARRELLYLAVLLHDIAKPRGVADHEISGVPIAMAVTRRIGFSELAADVGFLVRHHLAMEQIAFRRNIYDPETIREFAARFENASQLDYLFLLTFADLSAVNPGVWTEWKATMLGELYQRTSEVLRRNLKGEQVDLYHEARREEAEDRIVEALRAEVPPDEVRRHLDAIPNASYTVVFSPQEIARHIATAPLLDPVETLVSSAGGSTDVTVIARDAPFALSHFCAVLAANDATIYAADVFTRDDGLVIDRFRVSDAGTGGELTPKVCTKIAEDMRKVTAGKLDIDHLFLEHHRKWKRRPKRPENPTVRTDVTFEETQRYTIIDVYAFDRVGFLYRVTETMSLLGLNITFAKIATRVDGIVDAFYVLDRDGKAVAGAGRKEEIRKTILHTITGMAEQELTGGR